VSLNFGDIEPTASSRLAFEVEVEEALENRLIAEVRRSAVGIITLPIRHGGGLRRGQPSSISYRMATTSGE
jgi:hypothetical protein